MAHMLYFRDLGAHIDGFIAVVAHTFVVGASKVFAIISCQVKTRDGVTAFFQELCMSH